MRLINRIFSCAAVVSASCILPQGVSAIVFDLDAVTFEDGVLSQSFDIDPNHEGDDIRISFTRDTDSFQNYQGQDSPYTSDLFGDGTALTEESLALIVNFSADNMRVRVRIDFLYENGVTSVQIPIYDIDTGGDAGNGEFTFTDEIDRVRSRLDGEWTEFDASTVALNSNTNAYSVNRNSIYGIATTDNNADEGNILLDFEDTVMTRVTFDYRNFRPTTQDNPAIQGIGLGDIVFTPVVVPEPGQCAFLLGVAVLWMGAVRRRDSTTRT